MSIAEIIADLREAERELAEARAQASCAALRVSRARDVVANALHGSSPGQLLSLMDTARTALQAAVAQVEPARQGVADTVTLAVALDLDPSDVEQWVEHDGRSALRPRPPVAPGVVLLSAISIGRAIRRLFRRGTRMR